jgi:hypothetical protein
MYQEPGEYEDDWACLNCGKRISLEEMEELMKDITCTHCGQTAPLNERIQHSSDCPLAEANSTKEPEVASSSTKEYLDVGSLTREHKAEIAREAQEKGVKETAKAYGIPWVKVRAWIGAYYRKPKAERLMDAVKPKKKEAKQEPEKSPSATVVPADGLPSFPEFDSSWPEMVQLRWLDVYRDLARNK